MMEIPYVIRLACASVEGDTERAKKILHEALEEISNKFVEVINSYDGIDYPLVSFALNMTGTALTAALPEEGKDLVERLMPKELITGVDIEELLKQLAEEGD